MASEQNFHERLKAAWNKSDSPLCVGLDPHYKLLPERCARWPEPLFGFCRQIVNATAGFVCAFKPQAACFAAMGLEGELGKTIDYIHEEYPHVPVILDAKRADIGPMAELYAMEAFERYDADAVTVNPYLGWDAVEPFMDCEGRGVVVLCNTSNPTSPWLQQHPPQDPAYLRVAEQAALADKGNLGLVAGATYPEQLGQVRAKAPGLPLLVPGVGAQGGDVEAVFAHGLAADGQGLVINASRSVIFASDGDDWPMAAHEAAAALRDEMRNARDAALASASAPTKLT